MPTWARIVVTLLLVFTLAGAVGAFFAVRWLRGKTGELVADAKVIERDAEALGRGNNEEVCIAEALARADRCDGVVCQAKARAFLSRCLSFADVSPKLCEGVPSMRQFTAAAKWPLEECARRGRINDPRCMQVIAAIPKFCEDRR